MKECQAEEKGTTRRIRNRLDVRRNAIQALEGGKRKRANIPLPFWLSGSPVEGSVLMVAMLGLSH